MFNPETRKYVWDVCKKNYYDYGINAFWLDNSEPDYGVYDFDHYRYIDGPALSCSNIYPQLYSRVFYDGMKAEGEENIVNLLRCAWAGSQKYGNVVWSGDVPSTFEAFYDQLQAGLNMGLAGIPWWTTDIGGFMSLPFTLLFFVCTATADRTTFQRSMTVILAAATCIPASPMNCGAMEKKITGS